MMMQQQMMQQPMQQGMYPQQMQPGMYGQPQRPGMGSALGSLVQASLEALLVYHLLNKDINRDICNNNLRSNEELVACAST